MRIKPMFSKNTGLSTRKMNLNIFLQQRRLDKVEEYTTSTTVLSTLRLDERLGEGGFWKLYHLWQPFFLFLILGQVDFPDLPASGFVLEHAVKLGKKSNVCSPG